jgi:hypothetical protein
MDSLRQILADLSACSSSVRWRGGGKYPDKIMIRLDRIAIALPV